MLKSIYPRILPITTLLIQRPLNIFLLNSQILIAMLIGWGLCAILTICGVFTDDPNNIEYKARTDYNVEYIEKAPWIQFPYPG